MILARFFVLLVCFALSGCYWNYAKRLENLGRPPPLADVKMPQLQYNYKPVDWPVPEEEKVVVPSVEDECTTKVLPKMSYNVARSNSLWAEGARSFLKDNRARQVGDIIKISVKVSDKAALSNKSARNRKTSEDLLKPKIFGLENKVLSKIMGKSDISDDTSVLGLSGGSSNLGAGAIDRSEKIDTEIAAIVTQILPNGNLVIHGRQEIEVNFEKRDMLLKGIVRAEDITSDNSVDSSKIAELRLMYGGEGHMSEVQQPRLGTQLVDIFSPF